MGSSSKIKDCAFCWKAFRTGDHVEQYAGDHYHTPCLAKMRKGETPATAHASPPKPVVLTPATTDKGPKIPRSVQALAATKGLPKFKSKLEAGYYAHLQKLQRAGEILDFGYEVEKLRLADGAWYTPDFRVVRLDRTIEFHETKGFMREAARVRLLVAADRHPYRFLLVKKVGGGYETTPINQGQANE